MTIDYIPPGAMWFPDPDHAGADGLLAFGGDLSPHRLIEAYSRGIFPWYGPGDPILWWSPDPRLVLEPAALHVPRSMRRILNQRRYTVTLDTAFGLVIRCCAGMPRREGQGTWLVSEMVDAYQGLHEQGLAHSVEAWAPDGALAGGLYGVALGRTFFGESMFYAMPDASKTAFVYLARLLARWDYGLIDCQQTTRHLLRFGATEIPRRDFLARLAPLCEELPFPDAWTMPEDFDPLAG